MAYIPQDEVSLSHIKKDFEGYSFGAFRSDVIAGLTVAMLTVPQALAYAFLAGLPVACGLFAAIYAAMIAAIFGSSRHLIVGPSNAIAILIQACITEILFTYYRDVTGPEKQEMALQILSQLMLFVGIIQIAAAFFKLGRLTQFVSHTVIVGYVVGVALALVINQIFPLLGIPTPFHLSSLYERGMYILSHLTSAHWLTASIGMTCLIGLLLLKRIDKKMPAGAVMLGIVAGIAYVLNYLFNYFVIYDYHFLNWELIEFWVKDVALVGQTKSENLIPTLEWASFNPSIMNHILPVAFAIALLSVMEATSASKSTAASSGQRLSMNQEIFGVGMANFFAAFIGSMPVSGSATRTVISYESGAKTRLAAIFNSLFTLLFLVAFGFLIKHIPLAAFAALLIVSAGNIVHPKQLLTCLKATRSDALVLVLTIAACIFFSLDIAFYIGVVMSITLYLKKSAVPQLVEFSVDQSGSLHSIVKQEPRKIRFIKVEGELFFGAADLFQTMLKSIAEDDTTTRVIILQMKNARDIDATACLALEHLYEYLKASGKYLIGCGLTHQIWEVLCDSGMVELIGKNNLFIFDERNPYLSAQKAFLRANELINKEVTTPEIYATPVEVAINESEPLPNPTL